MRFVKRKVKKEKKKEACRESGLHPRSQFSGTSPSCQYSSAILPQVTYVQMHLVQALQCFCLQCPQSYLSSSVGFIGCSATSVHSGIHEKWWTCFFLDCFYKLESINLSPSLYLPMETHSLKTLTVPPDMFLFCSATWELARSKDWKDVKLYLKFSDLVTRIQKLNSEILVSSLTVTLLESWAS